jgi:hypothetical protein
MSAAIKNIDYASVNDRTQKELLVMQVLVYEALSY